MQIKVVFAFVFVALEKGKGEKAKENYVFSGVQNYVLGCSIALTCAIIIVLSIYRYRRKVNRLPDEVEDSAGDPLAPKPFQNMKMPKVKVHDSVRMSMFNGSTTSNSYDRYHITG